MSWEEREKEVSEANEWGVEKKTYQVRTGSMKLERQNHPGTERVDRL